MKIIWDLLSRYERGIWWDGFWAGATCIFIVEIVVGILWMALTGRFWNG